MIPGPFKVNQDYERPRAMAPVAARGLRACRARGADRGKCVKGQRFNSRVRHNVFSLISHRRQLLGLDITTSSIKLIELSMSSGQFRVESFAAEPTPSNAMNEKTLVDPQAVGDAIRRAVKRAGCRTRDAAIAISGDAAITKVIQMPRGLREGELEAQVEMQADQYIPFPMDEVAYDFEVLGPSE